MQHLSVVGRLMTWESVRRMDLLACVGKNITRLILPELNRGEAEKLRTELCQDQSIPELLRTALGQMRLEGWTCIGGLSVLGDESGGEISN